MLLLNLKGFRLKGKNALSSSIVTTFIYLFWLVYKILMEENFLM